MFCWRAVWRGFWDCGTDGCVVLGALTSAAWTSRFERISESSDLLGEDGLIT